MKTFAISVLLMALLTYSPSFGADAKEPTAWAKSSWGMTDAQIKGAFAGEAIDLPDTGRYQFRVAGVEEKARVGIGSVSVADTSFSVAFLTAPSGLHQVILSPVDDSAATSNLFATMQRALVIKYGTPFTNEAFSDVSITVTSQWKTKTSLVELRFVEFKGMDTKILTLSYEKLPNIDKL
jgi:hypothetical protein